MDKVGVFTPEQAREMWQWYQSQKQLPAQLTKNFPQRRPIDEVSPHRAFVLNSDPYEAIPPFACMQITGTDQYAGRTVITVEKPTTLDGEYLFNSPYQIEGGAAGWAYRFGVVVMLGQPPSEANVSYQPIIDSWEVEEGGGPFTVFGDYEITPESTTAALIGRFAGSGGGSQRIWFTVDSVECVDGGGMILMVEPTYYTGGCDATIPGEDEYGLVEVEDICSILSYYTAEGLVGMIGSATYMYPRGAEYCTPVWLVDSICGGPECA